MPALRQEGAEHHIPSIFHQNDVGAEQAGSHEKLLVAVAVLPGRVEQSPLVIPEIAWKLVANLLIDARCENFAWFTQFRLYLSEILELLQTFLLLRPGVSVKLTPGDVLNLDEFIEVGDAGGAAVRDPRMPAGAQQVLYFLHDVAHRLESVPEAIGRISLCPGAADLQFERDLGQKLVLVLIEDRILLVKNPTQKEVQNYFLGVRFGFGLSQRRSLNFDVDIFQLVQIDAHLKFLALGQQFFLLLLQLANEGLAVPGWLRVKIYHILADLKDARTVSVLRHQKKIERFLAFELVNDVFFIALLGRTSLLCVEGFCGFCGIFWLAFHAGEKKNLFSGREGKARWIILRILSYSDGRLSKLCLSWPLTCNQRF